VHGLVRGYRILDHPVGGVRSRRAHHAQARCVREVRLRAQLVVVHGSDVSAVRDTDADGHLQASVVTVRQLRELGRDLVERREHEAVELDLDDGAEARHREADRRADDAGLGERRVEHAVLTEVALQVLGDAEDTAELADVLAHEQNAAVFFHGPAEAGVHRPCEGHRFDGHSASPSNEASYSASQAACCSISACGSEYTFANMLAGSGFGSFTTRSRASAASASPSASTSA